MTFSAFSRLLVKHARPGWVALMLVAFAASAYAKDQVPDWVRAAAAQPTPSSVADADAVTLLEETVYTVAPDGTLDEHYRKVVRILRPQGRKFGDMYAHYNSIAKLRSMHLWSIGPDGHEYAVKDNELNEVGTGAGFELYSDGRARGGRVPAVDVGAIAAMEYEEQIRPYENDIVWIPGEDIPVVRERLTLNLPPGYTYRAAWKGKAKAEAVDAERGRTLWETNNQAPLVSHDPVPLSPNQISLASRLDIFYQGPNVAGSYGAMTGDWQSIGEWYGRLAKDRNRPDAAITAKAQELVQGKSSFRERTEAVANFVQGQIRYVAIEIGVGGNQPHPAADIFRARYGDCKDKATLLSAMLDAVGIHSTWVMVDTHRGAISKAAPSILGNHMVAAIELPPEYRPDRMYSTVTATSGKRFLIFDPTWEKTPFGQLEHELQGSDALLVDGPQSEAIRLPVLKPEQNSVERREAFQLNSDGVLSGDVQEQRNGDIASRQRYLFAGGTGKEQQDELEHELSSDLQALTVTGLQAQHVNALDQPLQVSFKLSAEHFARPLGPLLAVRPRVLGHEAFRVDNRPRVLPIDLRETQQVHDDVTIALPEGWDVDELPGPVDLELDFASYHSQTRMEQHALHYQRTYTVRSLSLPAERYADVQKLAEVIAADEQGSAILKHR